MVKVYSINFVMFVSYGPDRFYLGTVGKATGVDFDFGEPFPIGSPIKEVDVKIYAKHRSLIFLGGKGDDVIASVEKKNRDFDAPLAQNVPVSAYGEEGNDYLWGGKGADYLDGGAGNDTIKAFGGADLLFGDSGFDDFDGGPGNDEVDAIDKVGNEPIECGAGKDLANMDLKDLDSHCESFTFP